MNTAQDSTLVLITGVRRLMEDMICLHILLTLFLQPYLLELTICYFRFSFNFYTYQAVSRYGLKIHAVL